MDLSQYIMNDTKMAGIMFGLIFWCKRANDRPNIWNRPRPFGSDALLSEILRHVLLGRCKIFLYCHGLLVLADMI